LAAEKSGERTFSEVSNQTLQNILKEEGETDKPPYTEAEGGKKKSNT